MHVHRPAAVIAALAFIVLGTGLQQPAATFAATTTAFTTSTDPGGGHLIKGFLGAQPSLNAAALAMLREIHTELGARPTIVSAAQNPAQHSLLFVFKATRAHRALTGMSLVTAAGSEATGEAAYDTDARFSTTIGPMLGRLGTLKNPSLAQSAAPPIHFAPPEPLIAHPFPDGTGSIGVPADWVLRGGGGGSAVAVGPSGREVVNFNFTQGALEPASVMGQMLVNGTGIYARGPLQNGGMQRLALLHYTGDPVDAWTKSWAQMRKQTGRSEPSVIVRKVTRTGPHSAFVSGAGAYGGDAKRPFTYYAYLNIGPPPSRLGQWGMYFTYVIIPSDETGRETATATAILSSVKIDFGTLDAHIAASAKAFQDQFNAEIANQQAQNAARQASTDASIAQADATADVMRKEAVGMVNYALDRSAVVNTQTGVHGTVDNDTANALVDSNTKFRVLRPSELVSGVDY